MYDVQIFCFICLIIWAVDTVLQIVNVVSKRNEPPPPQTSVAAPASAPPS